MANNIIYTRSLAHTKPVVWGGQAVYLQYAALRRHLATLGAEHAELLAEPSITLEALDLRADAAWLSSYVDAPVAFPELSPDASRKAVSKLGALVQDIERYAERLRAQNDETSRRIGELLPQAILLPEPDMSCVLVQGDKIVLAAWGFTSDKAMRSKFRLSRLVFPQESVALNTEVPPVPQQAEEKAAPEEAPAVPAPDPSRARPEAPSETAPPRDTPVESPVAAVPPAPHAHSSARMWKMLAGALAVGLLASLGWTGFWKLSKIAPTPAELMLPERQGLKAPGEDSFVHDDQAPAPRLVVGNSLLVMLEPDSTPEAFAKALLAAHPRANVRITGLVRQFGVVQVEVPPQERPAWVERLRALPGVLSVEADAVRSGDGQSESSGCPRGWELGRTKAREAWTVTEGSPDVVVAVLDTGFDLNHPKLRGKAVKTWNALTGSPQLSPPGDNAKHGTHVAAIAVGGKSGDGEVRGICPECRLVAVQVGDEKGKMTNSAIINGLSFALVSGARVVNMSLGWEYSIDPALSPSKKKELAEVIIHYTQGMALFWDRLFQELRDKGVLVVQAAGNEGMNAAVDPMKRNAFSLMVGATSCKDGLADFSNFGSAVSISAPGVSIFNAVPGQGYAKMSGTSMASPMVAGAAALLLSVDSSLTPDRIKKILMSSGSPMAEDGTDKRAGPILQLDSALREVSRGGQERCSCSQEIEALNARIDQLQNRMESLKNDMDVLRRPAPPPPSASEFFTGRWKSVSVLTKRHDSAKTFSLRISLSRGAKGQAEYVESPGKSMTADLDVKINGDTLRMIQPQPARAQGTNLTRPAGEFMCSRRENQTMDCTFSTRNGDERSFTMVRE